MRSSTPSSSRSGSSRPAEPLPLRLSWRTSILLQTALASIGFCACIALWLSELPMIATVCAMPFVVASTLHRIAVERRAPVRALVIDAAGAALLDGVVLDTPQLEWRGPLAILRWRDGRRVRRLLWWPDTLPPPARRELRLAASALVTRPIPDSMAP
jgi:toxin CptA